MENIMKTTLPILLTLTLCLLSAPTLASPGYPQAHPQQQAQDTAAMMQQSVNQVLEFLRKGKASQRDMTPFLEQRVAPMFDFDYMAQWVAGRYYAQMDPARRAAFAEGLKAKLLTALASRLANYEAQQVRVMRPRRAGPNELKLPIAIMNPGGYPARVDLRLYQGAGGWKVFDVSANGMSLLAHFRSEFQRNLGR
jgi:phospholipid transport system substrate-binding protein